MRFAHIRTMYAVLLVVYDNGRVNGARLMCAIGCVIGAQLLISMKNCLSNSLSILHIAICGVHKWL